MAASPHVSPQRFRMRFAAAALFPLSLWAAAANAAAPQPGPTLTIQRATAPIVIDGDLDDEGWKDVTPVTTWYETNVGENAPPPAPCKGYLAYDSKYLYAAFQFDDPNPKLIRAPLADHDQLSSNTDYGGVIVDSRNDAKSAVLFLANPNGLQYDAVSNDATGEDNSPDFYWDSKGKVTATGYTLEMRIPFSSLRYSNDDVQTWGIMLYRNYPRDRHYQMFSTKLPKDVSCFICNENKLVGLAHLPHGAHLVIAPYGTAQRLDEPGDGLGTPLKNGTIKTKAGLDLKWSPLATMAIDATIKPDFSQVESDVAQIGANERFALFYPEKRSFFLEGIDLFSTPLQAVYTRSITSPEVGLRATGRVGNTNYTALVTRDEGQGLVILPGAEGSDVAPQDFRSDVGVVRLEHDLGQSFVSVLATGRNISGGGHNAVFGPDFRYRPRPTDTFTGEALWSHSVTPQRPDLAGEWDGRTLQDRALLARWSHNTRATDLFVQGQDIGKEFRADEGFIPQVGYREVYAEGGYTARPKKAFLSRIRVFASNNFDEDTDGHVLGRQHRLGTGMDGKLNSFLRVELNDDQFKVGDQMLHRFRPRVNVTTSPGRIVNSLQADVYFGDEIDFSNAREGTGTTITLSATLHPDDHLTLTSTASTRSLHVTDKALGSGRLFLAQVERLRASYSFNSRCFARVIGQYVQTDRAPELFTYPVSAKSAGFDFSALFAYKVDWQTVLYLGYGDQRAHSEATNQLERSGRQAFAKVSYAWQP